MSKNAKSIIKKLIRRSRDEFKKNLFKYIVWTVPLSIFISLFNLFINNVLSPSLEIEKMKVTIIDDKQIISEDNTSLSGREYGISDNLEVLPRYHYAPQLEIALKGKGKVKKAYVIYEQHNNFVIQKIKNVKPYLFGVNVKPDMLNVIINYATESEYEQKRVYFVFIGKNDDKIIWCGYLDTKNKKTKIQSSEDIYELMLYENEDSFSCDKEKIIQDITYIYGLNL